MKAPIPLVLALLPAMAAQAHTHLLQAIPADGSTVASAPRQLQLHFSEAATLTALSIGQQDKSEPIRLALPARQPAVDMAIELPPLARGRYVVKWRALSADHHVASGSISFTLGAP